MGKFWFTGLLTVILSCLFAVVSPALTCLKVPNPPSKYLAGELGKMVKLGEDIIMHTE